LHYKFPPDNFEQLHYEFPPDNFEQLHYEFPPDNFKQLQYQIVFPLNLESFVLTYQVKKIVMRCSLKFDTC